MGGGNAAPVVAGLAIGVGFFVLFAAVLNSSISPDVTQELLQQRSETSSMLAVSEVRKMLGSVSVIDLDYRWLPFDRDRVTVETVDSVSYAPLYANFTGIISANSDDLQFFVPVDIRSLENAVGYARTESGNNRIQVDIDRKTNAMLAAEVEPLPDRTKNVRFSEGHGKALKLVLLDDRVRELQAEQPYFVALMREVGSGGCEEQVGCILVGLGLLSEPRSGVHTVVIVDIATGRVAIVNPPLSER